MVRLNPVLAHNLLLRGELVRIARALNDAGIDFIVLKGVVLLQRVYGRLDARPVSDNDLLVRSADVERALAAFGDIGYEPKIQPELADALAADAKYVLERRLHGRNLWVDLHTNPLVPTIHRADEDSFWDHTELFSLDDVPLRVFSPELTLLHLVAHAEQHRFCEPRILRDIVAAWNTWTAPGSRLLDEGRLLGLAARLGLWHALDFVLTSAASLGLLDSPPPFMASRRARRLAKLLPPARLLEAAAPHGPESYKRSVATLLLREPDRVLAQFHKDLLPPLSKLAVIYDHPPSPVLYLHYATRPFRPLARFLGWRPPPPAGAGQRLPRERPLDGSSPRS